MKKLLFVLLLYGCDRTHSTVGIITKIDGDRFEVFFKGDKINTFDYYEMFHTYKPDTLKMYQKIYIK